MPIVDPLPTPYFRFATFQFDDESTYSQPKVGTFTFTAGAVTGLDIGTQSFVQAQFAGICEAIQRCFYIDLSGPVDPDGFNVDGGAAALKVLLITTVADVPTGVQIGNTTYTLGEAWSIAMALIAAGHGTLYVPS